METVFKIPILKSKFNTQIGFAVEGGSRLDEV